MAEIDFKKNVLQEKALDLMLSCVFTLLFGGSRSGKSFIIMFLILYRALKKKSRHLILRKYFSDVKKSIIKETLPQVSKVMGCTYKLNQQDFYLQLPNGSEIWFGGIDNAESQEKILGKEYSSIWFNEASQITYDAYSLVKTRLAEKSGLKNRIFIDENPPKKSHWTYQVFFKKIEPEDKTLLRNPEKYGQMQMNPEANLQNISEDYLDMLEGLPKKKRERFLLGQFADDELGALFSETNFNNNRVKSHPELKEIVVAVDPATTAKITSDETGIAIAGKGFDGRGYLLSDRSGIYSPKAWAEKVCSAYSHYDANWVVAEINQGGDMVKYVIQTADEHIPVKTIHAMKGKILRAEPISALYEDNKISHVNGFPDAEEEMANYTGEPGEKSPNRLDAIVYAFSHLFPSGVYSDSELFNRDNLQYWKDYDFTDSYDFIYIKLTSTNSKNTDYNFLALYAKIKDGKIFITDCIFNSLLPSDNIEQLKNKAEIIKQCKIKEAKDEAKKSGIKLNDENYEKIKGVGRLFLECAPSFVSFARELKSLKFPVKTVKEFTQEDNMIISESGFIKDTFVFEKDSGSTYYKSYMQQLNAYTTTADANESVAANILPSMSYVVKKLMKQYLKVKEDET